jgi:hypothetical protein
MSFTVEQLVAAIHEARSLTELKKMVGPSPTEQAQATARLAEIDRMYDQHGNNWDFWPWSARERYDRLMAEQNEFESRYH